MLVTAISSNDLTVSRALNGTTAAAHADNSDIDILRWPPSVERATMVQTARIWTRSADFEPFSSTPRWTPMSVCCWSPTGKPRPSLGASIKTG